MGVTYSSLRYYERIGLLSPRQSEENRYREYTSSHELVTALKKKKEEFDFEREFLERRIINIDRAKEELRLINEKEGFKISLEDHRLFLLSCEGTKSNPKTFELMSEWVQLLPITSYGERIKLSFLKENIEPERELGISIACEDSRFLSPEAREAAELLTLGACLTFICEDMPQGNISPMRLKAAFSYIEAQGYYAAGDIYLRSLPFDNEQGHKSFMAYIPIEKLSK